jgi:hypothetical protein
MDSLANNCKPSSDLIQQPKATILRILGLLYSPVRHQDSNCLSGLGREQTWTRDGVFDVSKPTESRGDRRRLLQHSIRQACLCTSLAAIDPLRRLATASLTTTPGKRRSVENVVGITIGGGVGRQEMRGELKLLDVPKYVSDEMGMKLIDLNTRWFKTYEPSFLERLRSAAERAGCFFTNLKVNHDFGDLYSANAQQRESVLNSA